MTPEQSQKLDEIHNQLTGSFNINEYLGFDIDALYTTAAGKGFTNLTLPEQVQQAIDHLDDITAALAGKK